MENKQSLFHRDRVNSNKLDIICTDKYGVVGRPWLHIVFDMKTKLIKSLFMEMHDPSLATIEKLVELGCDYAAVREGFSSLIEDEHRFFSNKKIKFLDEQSGVNILTRSMFRVNDFVDNCYPHFQNIRPNNEINLADLEKECKKFIVYYNDLCSSTNCGGESYD